MKKGRKTTGPEFSILTGKSSMILIVLLAGIPFALGRYFEFYYPDPYDSAANVYTAKRIIDGAVIGVDEKPSAALGTLLVNIAGVWAFGYSEFGPKLIQTVMQAGAFALMYVALRKLMGRLPAAVSVIVACIYTSAPLLAKFGNVKEQYMIACMVAGMSLFVLRQLGGGWWYALLAGAIASWAPLFKETGSSVIGAIGLFVLLQPILGHRTWRQTGADIALLLAGAVATMTPLYIWILGWHVQTAVPYSFVWDAIAGFLPKAATGEQASNYVTSLRSTISISEQAPKVLRYYLALCLPVSLAIGSIAARIGKMMIKAARRGQVSEGKSEYERFVLLFGLWWVLDMALVWVSPASYEQYYLPLTASGAMTGSYIVALWRDKLAGTVFRGKWVVTGIVGLAVMVVMSWHIFFGLSRSPYSGMQYTEKRNGYLQRWRDISNRRSQGWRGSWEYAGEYVRSRTQAGDKMYVWGWLPGIYLSAQRFSSAPRAFESEMHTRPPEQLAQLVDELLTAFAKEKPKYIVDSRKQHLPLDRFRFELWPVVPKGFIGFAETQLLPNDPQTIARFEKEWGEMERSRFGDDEAKRFEIMGHLRQFVRENYAVDQVFGEVVVFKLKGTQAAAGGR